MKDKQFIFIELLQSELERLVIPDPGSEVARNMTVMAARQLRRLLVDKTELPQLRRAAIAAYGELMPALQQRIDAGTYTRLSQALSAADALDWTSMEAVLYEAMAALLGQDDAASRQLAGQLAAIDARLRQGKEQAWIERSQAKPAAAAAASPGGDSDAQEARLLAFIQRQFPQETALRIASIKPIPGGFSKQTIFVNLENNVELPDTLVMRRDAAYETAGSSVTMEFPVIQKMYAAGVAVPKPFALDALGEVYGRPFILVSRVAGKTIGDFVVVREPSRELALDLAKKLARLHAVPFAGLENILDGGTSSTPQRLLAEIEKHEVMWQGVVNQEAYVVQAAIDWLKRNIHLADGPRSIVHRDVGVHNMLVHDNQVTAFLDWETAAVGTPAEDVAYAYYTVVQMVDWEEFLAAYEKASAATLDRRQLDFYMLWASVRVAVGMSRMTDPVFNGERINLAEYYLGDYFGQVLRQRIAAKLAEVLA